MKLWFWTLCELQTYIYIFLFYLLIWSFLCDTNILWNSNTNKAQRPLFLSFHYKTFSSLNLLFLAKRILETIYFFFLFPHKNIQLISQSCQFPFKFISGLSSFHIYLLILIQAVQHNTFPHFHHSLPTVHFSIQMWKKRISSKLKSFCPSLLHKILLCILHYCRRTWTYTTAGYTQ